MKMDPVLKSLWLKALRSGRYKQTTGNLRSDADGPRPTYCCLGVLCNVINSRAWDDNDWHPPKKEFGEAELCRGKISKEVRVKVGLPSRIQERLISMNDGLGTDKEHSFKEIADYIEKTL